MQELRPLVDEYRELEQVAAAARRVARPRRHARTAPARRGRKRSGARSASSSRATRGAERGRAPSAAPQTADAATPARRARGATAAATSCSTWSKRARASPCARSVPSSVSIPTSLYRIVHRLEQDGALAEARARAEAALTVASGPRSPRGAGRLGCQRRWSCDQSDVEAADAGGQRVARSVEQAEDVGDVGLRLGNRWDAAAPADRAQGRRCTPPAPDGTAPN